MGVIPPWEEDVPLVGPKVPKPAGPSHTHIAPSHTGPAHGLQIGPIKEPVYNCPVHGNVHNVTLTISAEGGTGFIPKINHNYCLYCIDDLLMKHIGELPLARPSDWMTTVIKEDEKNALHKKS
jgi:hypothetical protein